MRTIEESRRRRIQQEEEDKKNAPLIVVSILFDGGKSFKLLDVIAALIAKNKDVNFSPE